MACGELPRELLNEARRRGFEERARHAEEEPLLVLLPQRVALSGREEHGDEDPAAEDFADEGLYAEGVDGAVGYGERLHLLLATQLRVLAPPTVLVEDVLRR